MSLGQRLVLLLEFLEEAHILDGDDGLVGEGLQEDNVLVRKRSDLGTADEDRAERLALRQQRGRECRPVAIPESHRPAFGELILRRGEIVDMNRTTIYDGATGDPAPADRKCLRRR